MIRPDPKDPSPLRIDEVLVRKMLVLFIRDETTKARLRRAVIGVSGGVDSAVTVALAAEALGPENVLALFTPYRTSSPESRDHAQQLSRKFGFTLEEVHQLTRIDPWFLAQIKEIVDLEMDLDDKRLEEIDAHTLRGGEQLQPFAKRHAIIKLTVNDQDRRLEVSDKLAGRPTGVHRGIGPGSSFEFPFRKPEFFGRSVHGGEVVNSVM